MKVLIITVLNFSIFQEVRGAQDEAWPDLPQRGDDYWHEYEKHRWLKWYSRRVMVHMELMTEEINKQVFQRLKHGEKYVELDDETNVYMMGKMAESMKETFRKMIMTYKLYNKYSDLKAGHFSVLDKQLAGLTIIESYYNRILFERREFHKAMQGYFEELMLSSKVAYEATRTEGPNRRAMRRTPVISDGDYKMQLRKNKFEEKRASFNPEIEGFDIDLGDGVF